MGVMRHEPKLARETVKQGVALVCLLFLGGVAIAGPSGLIALGEQRRMLEQREQQVAALSQERDRLRNRVDLLDPKHADADLAGELLRSELNVAHPDEMVMLLR
ncbi:septum formation initiator [Novosphingobium sp. PC22D]|uniref:FtsB family cell division protein n=1 Tax=Novosphingobium sp. PC22D TaxID=1962403 RepID=UPI000BF136A5|nr:septum formation initiator family protein [Novosphingobium sp. PC22D]PEQ11244.1 septum formation initiator [Novosphingobium sp. PC22D]